MKAFKNNLTMDPDIVFIERPQMTFIFNYGCPRSGTTIMQAILQRLQGVYHHKIDENYRLHPCQEGSLLDLAQIFSTTGDNVIFVRTIRNPIDIMESFYYARLWEKERFGDKVGPGIGGLSYLTDEDIKTWIIYEDNYTSVLKKSMSNFKWNHRGRLRHIEIRYEDLHKEGGQNLFIASLCGELPDDDVNRANLYQAFKELWNKKPVREGKLSREYQGQIIPEETKKKLCDDFYHILKKNGYDNNNIT